MDVLTETLLGLALSVDCFAIAATITSLRNIRPIEHVKIPAHFGLFHFVQLLIGFFLGVAAKNIIDSYDHWIAFILLVFIGGKIIYESIKDGHEKSKHVKLKSEKSLLILSFASSIDALVLGIALSIINGNIYVTAGVIAATVFIVSLVGLEVGERISKLDIKYIEIIGGLVLIGIGLKTLIGHLFF